MTTSLRTGLNRHKTPRPRIRSHTPTSASMFLLLVALAYCSSVTWLSLVFLDAHRARQMDKFGTILNISLNQGVAHVKQEGVEALAAVPLLGHRTTAASTATPIAKEAYKGHYESYGTVSGAAQ
jgi:hypothetical protein